MEIRLVDGMGVVVAVWMVGCLVESLAGQMAVTMAVLKVDSLVASLAVW